MAVSSFRIRALEWARGFPGGLSAASSCVQSGRATACSRAQAWTRKCASKRPEAAARAMQQCIRSMNAKPRPAAFRANVARDAGRLRSPETESKGAVP